MCFEEMESKLNKYMPSIEVIEKLASYFQGYCDVTRIKILTALSMFELNVTDLSRMLNVNQTTISHQLKILRTLSLVKFRRNGKEVFYSLSNDIINKIMLGGVEHIQECYYIINSSN